MWYDASVAAGSGGGKDYKMARTARIKKSNNGTARYHLMSRTNDRRFLFEKGRVKTQLVDALKRAAAFSGVELEAYVAMDNHFHIVCKVVRGGGALPEGELIRRVAALKGERAAEDLASHWEELRGIGMDSAVVEAQDRLRARMNDVSEFIKTFKELFNVWFKREHGYSGSIWDGRFKSTLVEDGRYRAICMRYVYLNPATPLSSSFAVGRIPSFCAGTNTSSFSLETSTPMCTTSDFMLYYPCLEAEPGD